MTIDEFWDTIALARTSVGDNVDPLCEQQAAATDMYLRQLSLAEIVDFNRIFHDFMEAANDWRLWAAAYIINGGCSDDGFVYFRCWLIAQGKEIFTLAVHDPDSLAGIVDPEQVNYEGEPMLYAARQAYEARTKSRMPPTKAAHGNTRGVQWTEADLAKLLPRLSFRYRLS